MHYEKSYDDVLETAMMLSYGTEVPLIKEMMISALNEHDIDGERFFSMHLEESLKLIESFIKYRVVDDDDIYFSIASFEFQGLLFLPLLLNRSFLEVIHKEHKEALQKLLIQSYNTFYEADIQIPERIETNGLFLITRQMELNEQSKWILLTILYDPIPYYKQLAHILKANIPALHKAFDEHAAFIEQSLQEFYKKSPNIYSKEESYRIIPSISNPVSILELEPYAYCGIMWHNLLSFHSQQQSIDSNELAFIIKVLADKTRLEILKLLKEAPSYNLEIAQKLSLTPATVSHHMTALIMRKFVILEKHGGYTYYHLNQDVLSTLIQHLNLYLL